MREQRGERRCSWRRGAARAQKGGGRLPRCKSALAEQGGGGGLARSEGKHQQRGASGLPGRPESGVMRGAVLFLKRAGPSLGGRRPLSARGEPVWAAGVCSFAAARAVRALRLFCRSKIGAKGRKTTYSLPRMHNFMFQRPRHYRFRPPYGASMPAVSLTSSGQVNFPLASSPFMS